MSIAALAMLLVCSLSVWAQYVDSKLAPPPSVPAVDNKAAGSDSLEMKFKVHPTIPQSFEDYKGGEYAADLKTPSNVTTVAEYDSENQCYVIRTKIGDREVVTPFMMTASEYNDMVMRQSMQEYYRQKNSLEHAEKKDPFNFLDMQFGLGPLEKVFGPGGVQLKTQGSVQINMGIKSNKTDNPALAMSQRRKTYFDFDQKIQATINASVGDKMKFNMTYNTAATFDFDNKNLKLAYEGKEDEIIKNIEAGNVSMTTGSSLIKGSTALFGIKTKLQFGKLTATALVAQQNSTTQSVSTKGGAQTSSFEVNGDSYDANRHYFLSHFFRENYDQWCTSLPLVSSGLNITRIEVWVTNKKGDYNQTRNLVAYTDLGENSKIANHTWVGSMQFPMPTNNSNTLYSTITSDQYADARYIAQVATAFAPLAEEPYNFVPGKDYEKVESARLLSSSEYTLNNTLGYISLKTALNSDEVLAVAYQYTYRGQTYQVGEFSGDITATDQSLYLKMLKATTQNTALPMWHLMMKNVYSLGAYSMQKAKFKLQVKYLSDTTGMSIPYIPDGKINGVPLIQVLNVDRLDANNNPNPDGQYDYIEGYTVNSSTGRIIFPVVEPFGSHLRKKFENDAIADKYVYQELYDSTLVVARQVADKNKFILQGEYQASSGGSQIRLNAMNVPRGSVTVTAGGVRLTENSDYTVDYNMGIVTITNQSIIDAGTSINVSLENQQMYSTQRKSLLGLDLNYQFSKNFNVGGTVMHYSEKSITEKVAIGSELVNNTIWGLNFAYNTQFMWLTNLLNKIPTVNATAPSTLNVSGEFAQLVPHQQKSGTNAGSSYIDDFETTQSGIDLRSPYSWFLASTPYNPQLFPESSLSDDIRYGYNRALLSWYFIDRMFTQRNSSLAPGYIKNDLKQLSNPYVREVSYNEVFPGRELSYGESTTLQTLNLSFYPDERGPYNLDTDVDDKGRLRDPKKRWGGIMRKIDNTNFQNSNIEYIQFWMLNPFLDKDLENEQGGDLYFNLGDVSEDVLKDGRKSYENGLPIDEATAPYVTTTEWGKVSTQTSLTYAFDTASGSRPLQDVGLNGLSTQEEFGFENYQKYVQEMHRRVTDPETVEKWTQDKLSPFNDPAGDNYHFYRGYDFDEQRLSVLERYKHYNGTEGNSLSVEEAGEALYQSSRSVPDVEDINQDNTLNESERYFQYRVSIRPEDLKVGVNHITDIRRTEVTTRDGEKQYAEWIQFTIPLKEAETTIGTIKDLSSIRFMRMFMHGFERTTHLRFATLELIRGEWRIYDYNLNNRGETPAEGEVAVTAVNIEENGGREPVNYVLPPGVTRIVDSGQSQITQLNEQSMQVSVKGLAAGDARAVYRNTQLDLRIYKRLQMFVHNEALIGEEDYLKNGDVSVFVRLGSDVKNNYYEYEIPLLVTPPGKYSTYSTTDREIVWPNANMLDIDLDLLTNVKKDRNAQKAAGVEGVSYAVRFSEYDPDKPKNKVTVIGNPSLGDVRMMMIGVRNNATTTKNCIVWVDELRVTDFDQKGGWAAKGNVTLGLSDIGTVNAMFHKETVGFGSVDQSLSNRRLDDYQQYNVAVQVDMGRFLPEKAKLRAPIYYSISNEKTSPKYNPLDQDIELKDALDACATKQQRDSINAYAITNKKVESFSVSGLKFDVQSKNPMPWDPANFTFSYSSNKQRNTDPDNEFENTSDYRGSFQYSYSPYFKPFKPFGKSKSKSKNMKFLKDWEFNWLPTSIGFMTNISRYYYEQQTRNETDVKVSLPVSVSKNFLWDRQFSITWNFTKSLSMTFNSNTTAHIEEPVGAVNRRLFPDQYREWRDSVWRSIRNLGTPYNYNQTFTASYRAPFNKIPAIDFLTGTVTYNATYKWDRGTVINSVSSGNTISNQASWNGDARINFEQIYNKIPYLKDVNKKFASSRSRKATNSPKKPKKYERTMKLKSDTTLTIKHNMRTKKVKISAKTTDGKLLTLKTKVIDENNIEVLDTGSINVKFLITEDLTEDKKFWKEFADHSARLAMLVRSVSVKYRNTKSLSLPQFVPNVGAIFGQSRNYDILSPGLDFAFGFTDESYVEKAKERGWLLCDDSQTSPAVFSRTEEFNAEINLEPIRGLKIVLTGNRTDNRTNQLQFMYHDMTTLYSGSYTKTHMALATAMRTSSAKNGYKSKAFDDFINNIPIIAERLEQQYSGTSYPNAGFIANTPNAGQPYNPKVNGGVNRMSSDVLIPAFMAAYSGKDAHKVDLNPFPGLKSILPNWRITYDGISQMDWAKKWFKNITISHAYQCTYSVGSYSSYTDWVTVSPSMGFVQDATQGTPRPSSAFNISSVSVTERFSPLVGLSLTMNNNVTVKAEYKNSRTLTLNSSAGQIVEAFTRAFEVGAGYKIANFNTILKMKNKQQGVNNDLTLNFNFSLGNNTSLIRKIESMISQATNGTRTLAINFTANYVMSKRITIGAYFDHQVNTPLVSSSAYPTTNSNYGISINLSLAK